MFLNIGWEISMTNIIDKATIEYLINNHSCKNPILAARPRNIKDFNYIKNGVLIINQHCYRCLQHWYGEVGNVTEYTSKEWDIYLKEE